MRKSSHFANNNKQWETDAYVRLPRNGEGASQTDLDRLIYGPIRDRTMSNTRPTKATDTALVLGGKV